MTYAQGKKIVCMERESGMLIMLFHFKIFNSYAYPFINVFCSFFGQTIPFTRYSTVDEPVLLLALAMAMAMARLVRDPKPLGDG